MHISGFLFSCTVYFFNAACRREFLACIVHTHRRTLRLQLQPTALGKPLASTCIFLRIQPFHPGQVRSPECGTCTQGTAFSPLADLCLHHLHLLLRSNMGLLVSCCWRSHLLWQLLIGCLVSRGSPQLSSHAYFESVPLTLCSLHLPKMYINGNLHLFRSFPVNFFCVRARTIVSGYTRTMHCSVHTAHDLNFHYFHSSYYTACIYMPCIS